MARRSAEKNTWLSRLHAIHKLIGCLVLAIIAYVVFPPNHVNKLSHLLFAWDVFGLCMIIISWITFFSTQSSQIREESKKQDESRVIIFIIVLVSTLASLSGVVLLLLDKKTTGEQAWQVPIALASMVFSWLLVHTVFAFRYAHIYYGNDVKDEKIHTGGLNFQDEKKPDFIDFAYFSFVIGMTCQTSDTEITSKRFRRLVLLHGLISFAFNTFILALTINVIGSLGGK